MKKGLFPQENNQKVSGENKQNAHQVCDKLSDRLPPFHISLIKAYGKSLKTKCNAMLLSQLLDNLAPQATCMFFCSSMMHPCLIKAVTSCIRQIDKNQNMAIQIPGESSTNPSCLQKYFAN